MNNNRGYTLIELLIVLALSSIILTIVVSFFINNNNNYVMVMNDTDLQYEAQFITNFISDDLMEGSYVDGVRVYEGNNHVNKIDQSSVDKLYKLKVNKTYNGTDETTTATSIYYVTNNQIHYTDKANQYVGDCPVLGEYIDSIKLTAIPLNSTFETAKGLKFEINFINGNRTFTTEQIVYFRNAN